MSASLGEILDALDALAPEAQGAELLGAARSLRIERLAPLDSAGAQELSFARDATRSAQLMQSRAACVLVPPALRAAATARGACIVVPAPDVWFAHLTRWWKARHPQQYPPPAPGIHVSAVVDERAHIAPTASVGPLCVVGAHSRIGEHTVLGARVVIGEHCHIGARCIIHPGAVIGADGFGFARQADAWLKVEQLGGVRIGDDVEIGANTCIDRGALGDTVIADGAKLDNLIQIGHNVHIGAHTAMAGCTGVAGSTHIGAHCTIGGHASIIGHLHISDRIHIAAATTVSRSLRQSGAYAGVFPLDEKSRWEKNAATLRQLHQLRERIKTLEQQCLPPEPP